MINHYREKKIWSAFNILCLMRFCEIILVTFHTQKNVKPGPHFLRHSVCGTWAQFIYNYFSEKSTLSLDKCTKMQKENNCVYFRPACYVMMKNKKIEFIKRPLVWNAQFVYNHFSENSTFSLDKVWSKCRCRWKIIVFFQTCILRYDEKQKIRVLKSPMIWSDLYYVKVR